MALQQHPLADIQGPQAALSAAVLCTWAPSSASLPVVLQPPSQQPPPPCELTIALAADMTASQLTVVLACAARLLELRTRRMIEREPQYIGTVRGQAETPAGSSSVRLWRFRVELPPGCVQAQVKLLSLPDKGSCTLQSLELQRAEEAEGSTAAAAEPDKADAAAAAPHNSAPRSQLDELRLLVEHAAASGNLGCR